MRRLALIFAAASLMLLAFTATLWVTSYRRAVIVFDFRWEGVLWELRSQRGWLVLDDWLEWWLERQEVARLAGEEQRARDRRAGAMFKWKQLEWPAAALPDAQRREAVGRYTRAEQEEERAAQAWYDAVMALSRARGERRVMVAREYSTPHAAVIVAAAVLPLAWGAAAFIAGVRRRRRQRAGLCPGCGYDRRGSAGKCPECGADTPAASAADRPASGAA